MPGSRSIGMPVQDGSSGPRPAIPSCSRSRSSKSLVASSACSRIAISRASPKPDDQRNRQRSASQPALVTAAVEQRRQPDLRIAAADVQHTDPFGSIDFVAGDAEKIDRAGLHVERHLADGLGGVGVEDDAAFVAQPADLGDRVDRADLVVGGHDRDQHGSIGDGVGDGVGRNPSMLVAGNDGDLPAFAGQPFDRVENGLVLGGGRDEMVAAPGRRKRDSLDGQVVRFGGPRGEDDFSWILRRGRAATCSRARSTASLASQPKRCDVLAALPYSSVKYGNMASTTRGSRARRRVIIEIDGLRTPRRSIPEYECEIGVWLGQCGIVRRVTHA